MRFARQGGLVSTQQIASRDGAIRLRKILPDARRFGMTEGSPLEIPVRSCCSEWSEVQSDDIYVAIVGSEFDGHDFARNAIENGAVAIVTERLLAIDTPQFIVSDSRLALGEICHALAGQPSQRLKTVGVSGSDGKTVTSHLIQSIFKEAGAETGLLSTIENSTICLDGKTTGKKTLTRNAVKNPRGFSNVSDAQQDDQENSATRLDASGFSAAGLADCLSTMVLNNCSHAVVEVPCEALAQYTLAGTRLDAAVLTNIRYDELGFHRTRENYRRAILRLLEYLKPDGIAVLNADDPASHFLLNDIDKPVLTIGMKQAAEVTAKILEQDAASQTFMLTAGAESIAVRSATVGDQHIYNCLSAAAIGLAHGIGLDVIARGLETAGTIPGRLEKVDCGQSFNVWVDSSRSNRQLATALKSVKNVTTGKVWCVCSTSAGQTSKQRRQMGEIVESSAHRAVITQAGLTNGIDYEPSHQVLDGFDRVADAEVIANRFRAIEWALAQAGENDTVLITGCGERPVARVGDGRWAVSDRDICQAWLYDRNEPGNRPKPDSGIDGSDPQIFNIDDYR